MAASLIIIAHNGLADLTIPFMKHLNAVTVTPHELICIDDGSTDGTYSYFKHVADIAIRLPRRSGPGPARNAGMLAASGDFLAFVDNDAYPPLGWLGVLGSEMGKQRVGIVGAIPSDETWRLSEPVSLDGLIDVNHVGTACAAVSAEVFDRLGYLNTDFALCGTDTDYSYRAWLSGFRVVSTPRVIVPHLRGATRKHLDQGEIERTRRRFWQKWTPYAHLFPIRYPEVTP